MANGRLEKETIEFNKIENKLKSLPKIFGDYYYTLRAEKKSYGTISEYIGSVRHFMEHVTKGKDDEIFYRRVEVADINRYLGSLESKIVGGETLPTSRGYISNKWKALNSFFEFLVNTGNIDKNPIPQDSRPKEEHYTNDITYLTPTEISGIIRNILRYAKITMVNRDLSIFIMGITTGLRVSAIIQLNVEDIDLERGRIRITNSSGKYYEVLIGNKLNEALSAWLSDRELYFDEANTNALFISQHGQRISYDAVRKLLLRYSEWVTNKKITPECLRHTCAMNLYEKTGDINLTSAQLHHASLNSTARYADAAKCNLKDAVSILDDLV